MHQLSFLKFFEICQDRKAMTHRDHGCVNFEWGSLYIAADRCALESASKLSSPSEVVQGSFLLVSEVLLAFPLAVRRLELIGDGPGVVLGVAEVAVSEVLSLAVGPLAVGR